MTLLAPIILLGSMFYYVGKGVAPALVTGKTVYPALFALAGLLLFMKMYLCERIMSRELTFISTCFGMAAFILYLVIAQGVGDMARFNTNFTQYFGIYAYFLVFYFLFAFARYHPSHVMRLLIVVLFCDVIIEACLIRFGLDRYMVHYESSTVHNMKYFASVTRIIGLLGNTSNTNVLFVALIWFYRAYARSRRWWLDPYCGMLGLGFLMTFSGTGMLTLLITISLYRPIVMVGGMVSVMPAFFYLAARSQFFGKFSISYLLFMTDWLVGFIVEFLEQIYLYPQMLLFGAPTAFSWGNRDVSFMKSVTDFGLTPLVLVGILLYLFVRNVRAMPYTEKKQRLLILGMASLVIGTIHYPVLFVVPIHALIGYLVAYYICENRSIQLVSGGVK
jgi:hypothetical protein